MFLLKIIAVIMGVALSEVASMTADPAYYSQPPPHATTYDGQPLPRRPFPRRNNAFGTHLPLRQDYMSRRQDIYPNRHQDNYQIRQQDNFPMSHQDNFPINHPDNFPINHQDNFPINHQDNFPLNHQDNFPVRSQDNFPLRQEGNFPNQQDNFPLRPQDNYPLRQQDNYPLRQQDNFVTGRPFLRSDLDRTGRQMRYRGDVQDDNRDRPGYYPNRDQQQRDYPGYNALNDRDGRHGYAPNYQDSRRSGDDLYSGAQRFPLDGPIGVGGRSTPIGYDMHLKR